MSRSSSALDSGSWFTAAPAGPSGPTRDPTLASGPLVGQPPHSPHHHLPPLPPSLQPPQMPPKQSDVALDMKVADEPSQDLGLPGPGACTEPPEGTGVDAWSLGALVQSLTSTLDFTGSKVNDQLFSNQSMHPFAGLAHLSFKVLTPITYLFGSLLGLSFIPHVVLVIWMAATDFWITKNISGRYLIRMRWWVRHSRSSESSTGMAATSESTSESSPEPASPWLFETDHHTNPPNPYDVRLFYLGQYAAVVVWGLLAILTLLRLEPLWFAVTLACFYFPALNTYAYIKCNKVSSGQDLSQLAHSLLPDQIPSKAQTLLPTATAAVVGIAALGLKDSGAGQVQSIIGSAAASLFGPGKDGDPSGPTESAPLQQHHSQNPSDHPFFPSQPHDRQALQRQQLPQGPQQAQQGQGAQNPRPHPSTLPSTYPPSAMVTEQVGEPAGLGLGSSRPISLSRGRASSHDRDSSLFRDPFARLSGSEWAPSQQPLQLPQAPALPPISDPMSLPATWVVGQDPLGGETSLAPSRLNPTGDIRRYQDWSHPHRPRFELGQSFISTL